MLENTALKLEPSNVTKAGLVGSMSNSSKVQVFGSTGANLTAVAPGKFAGPERRVKYVSGSGALCRTYVLNCLTLSEIQLPTNAPPLELNSSWPRNKTTLSPPRPAGTRSVE